MKIRKCAGQLILGLCAFSLTGCYLFESDADRISDVKAAVLEERCIDGVQYIFAINHRGSSSRWGAMSVKYKNDGTIVTCEYVSGKQALQIENKTMK